MTWLVGTYFALFTCIDKFLLLYPPSKHSKDALLASVRQSQSALGRETFCKPGKMKEEMVKEDASNVQLDVEGIHRSHQNF